MKTLIFLYLALYLEDLSEEEWVSSIEIYRVKMLRRTIEIVRTLSCLFELYELSRKILCPAHSQLYIDILEINMFTRSTLAYLIYKYQLVNFRY